MRLNVFCCGRERGDNFFQFLCNPDGVWAVATDREGRWLASASEDTAIRVWDTRSWKLLRILRGHTGAIMSLAFSPDGRRLVSGSRDHTVKFWDTARWSEDSL